MKRPRSLLPLGGGILGVGLLASGLAFANGGEFFLPQTATRTGWNIWPVLIFRPSAAARSALSRPSCVNSVCASTTNAVSSASPAATSIRRRAPRARRFER